MKLESPGDKKQTLPEGFQAILGQMEKEFPFVFENPENYRLQIIYTQINRENSGVINFQEYKYRANNDEYFYPASTVKLPVSVFALETINKDERFHSVSAESRMITLKEKDWQEEVRTDTMAASGLPSIASYIKQILLVSDNASFNRLYEFLGPSKINQHLYDAGFEYSEIVHRLSILLEPEQNRELNPIQFLDQEGQVICERPALTDSYKIEVRPNELLGKAYIKNGSKIEQPFNFGAKNKLTLSAIHHCVQSIFFPGTSSFDFDITSDQRKMLQRYMGLYPGESLDPVYDSSSYYNFWVKFLLFGSNPESSFPSVRSFNKVGFAYGFVTDAAYIVDLENGVDFLLSATIHVNENETYNDNEYAYETLAFPFMRRLGELVLEYEKERKRTLGPDVNALRQLLDVKAFPDKW